MARIFKHLFVPWLVVACLVLEDAITSPHPFELLTEGSGDPLYTSTTTEPEGSGDTTPLPTSEGTLAPGTCEPNQCGAGSTCEPRANGSVACLCMAGDSYNTNSRICESAKVFPGELRMADYSYSGDLSSTSPEFHYASRMINDEMKMAFDSLGYSETILLKLSPVGKVSSRAETGVIATVQIIFRANAPISSEDVTSKIEKMLTNCNDCQLKGATFTEHNLCNSSPCEACSTICTSGNGLFTCTCLTNYIKSSYSDRMCIAACPSGQKLQDSKCVDCPFGYTGFNCNESWQLILVIVGSVLGGLLLITLILLGIGAFKYSKKSSRKNKEAGTDKPYVSQSAAKTPLASTYDNDVPRIPRATPTSRWDSKANLEMTPSNSRQNLVPGVRNSRLYEDRDDVAPYAQTRFQNNNYAQNRPRINPYAQGNTNPNYTRYDER